MMSAATAIPGVKASERPSAYSIIPDAYDCLMPQMARSSNDKQSLWVRQKMRRAEILRQTRILVGEEGCDNFSVRYLAKICGLSPQTIYNLTGDRDFILASAIDRYQKAMLSSANVLAMESGLGFFMGLPEICCGCVARNPSYIKNVTLCYFSPSSNLNKIINNRLLNELLENLEVIRRQSKMRETTRPEMLAGQIQTLMSTAALEWGEHRDHDLLRRQLTHAIGISLLGGVKPQMSPIIESWLASDHSRGLSTKLS